MGTSGKTKYMEGCVLCDRDKVEDNHVTLSSIIVRNLN